MRLVSTEQSAAPRRTLAPGPAAPGSPESGEPSTPRRSAANLRPLAQRYAPRWTWRAVAMAGAVTLGLYLMLPYLERLSAPPEKALEIRSVTTAELPPPPPPPPPARREPPPAKPKTPQPELEQLKRRLTPLQAAMNLSMAMGEVGGDFSVDFGVSAPELTEQVRDLVFELSELDEPPRPLARLQPIYPPQARMRRIEGMVELEFVVSAEGAAREIRVLSSQPGELFTEAAIRAIERWRFAPGTKAGQPVAARVRQKVTFNLN